MEIQTYYCPKHTPRDLRENMESFLAETFPDADEFDIQEAIYWYAADKHRGQHSKLYAVLSSSIYKPGPLERAPSEMGMILYTALDDESW